MPPRRRRAEQRPRRWPIWLMFALGALAGLAFWAYSPDLPADLLINRYANSHSTFIDVAGARAHVRDQGNPDGFPLVMIHGSLESLDIWEDWVRELGSRTRLISVDLPGHGLTGTWPRDEYTIEAYADFIEVLVDTLHLDRFALAGHSMGGAVAWNFAETRPERVSHLILVDARGFASPSGTTPLSLRLARLPVIGSMGIYFKPEMLARRTLLEVYADPAMVTPERIKRYADLQRFPGNRHATLQRLRNEDPLDPSTLKRLDVPTLLIWGAKDKWLPPADAFRFQSSIKGAQLAIFEKLGHDPMEEDPAATAAAVAAFLPARLEPPPPAEQPQEPMPQQQQEQGTSLAAPDAPAQPAMDDPQQQQQSPRQPQQQQQTVQPTVTPEKD
jgi:pimeloyl-ACP methyl ester carboxylesterase